MTGGQLRLPLPPAVVGEQGPPPVDAVGLDALDGLDACGHPFPLPLPCPDCEFRRVDRDPRSGPGEYVVMTRRRRRRGRRGRKRGKPADAAAAAGGVGVVRWRPAPGEDI